MSRRALAAALAPALLLLAGCTPTVALDPAPQATSVGCAGIVVRLPPTIGSEQQRDTNAQGTAAWGTPASVTLRCGLTPVVVSSEDCFRVDGVDWLRVDQKISGAERIVITTYGRDPAVQVVVGPPVSVNDVLPPVSDAVLASTTSTNVRCVAPDEAKPLVTSSPSPTAPAAAPTPSASR